MKGESYGNAWVESPADEAQWQEPVVVREFAGVEVGPKFVDGFPELLIVVAEKFAVAVFEDFHANVEGEVLAVEESEVVAEGEEVLGGEDANVGDAYADVFEDKVGE